MFFWNTVYNTENHFWKLIQDLEDVHPWQISDLGEMLQLNRDQTYMNV